jgi:hypothetical protein
MLCSRTTARAVSDQSPLVIHRFAPCHQPADYLVVVLPTPAGPLLAICRNNPIDTIDPLGCATWEGILEVVRTRYTEGSPQYEWVSNIVDGKYSPYVQVVEAEEGPAAKPRILVSDQVILFNEAASSERVVDRILESRAWGLHGRALGGMKWTAKWNSDLQDFASLYRRSYEGEARIARDNREMGAAGVQAGLTMLNAALLLGMVGETKALADTLDDLVRAGYQFVKHKVGRWSLRKAAATATANLTRLAEQDVVVGMIRKGQVLKRIPYPADPMLAPTHEVIAKELGVWVGKGRLAPGVEAFTVWKEGGKIMVRGSGNYSSQLSAEAEAALRLLFE